MTEDAPAGGDVAMAAFAADGRVLWSNPAFDRQFGEGPNLTDLRDLDRRRMQALLANIADTVTLVDEEGTILYTSGFHSDVLGYEPDEWQARSILELTHPDDLDDVLIARQQVIASPGREFRTEVRVRAADSGYQWVELSAVNLLEDPAVGGIVITTRNVTARKELEQELAERRDHAVEDARIRSEFVARVTHELRNQVHALHGLTELLGRADVPDPARDLAASAHREAEQLEFLVGELLDYSRLDAHEVSPQQTACDLRTLVDDLATTGRRLAATGVEVAGTLRPGTPQVVVTDGNRLRQVLLNLVTNAVRLTTVGRVDLHVGVEGTELVAVVTDTGPGVEPADLERIFLPFERAGGRADGAGAGLGLAISRRAVEILGGSLGVDSRPGAGAAFTVRVPCRSAPAEAAPGTGAVATTVVTDRSGPGPLQGRRILVVEDTPAVQQLLTEQLGRLGVESVLVDRGEAALEELGRIDRLPDCVLVDLQLPGIDGAETARRIRAEPHLSAIPVIGVSADAGGADRERALRAGMDELLAKPLGIDQLAAVLTRYVAGTATGAGVDLTALDELARDLGGTAPVRRVVQTFLDELDGRLEQVLDGCGAGEPGPVRHAAHALRSTSRTLGAHELDRCCTELEVGPFPPTTDQLERFSRAVADARDTLGSWVADSAG